MNWAILLGSPDISGGTYVIFEHATRALERGIHVTIVTEQPVEPHRHAWHPQAKSLTFKTYEEVKEQRFDVAIATWWPTTYELHRIQAQRYLYFVQSIESRFYPDDEGPTRKHADATYMMGLPVITEARWICDYLHERYDADTYLVPNGIRKDIYTPTGKAWAPREAGKLRVLLEGPLKVAFKNVERTIEIVKQSLADEVWLLTSSEVGNISGVDRVFSRVPISETPDIYRSCDVIVKLSYVEGMFGPPLEMFHCGGTAITYDVSGHDEYIRHQKNALVAPRDDEAKVVEWINRLKQDPELLEGLKQSALQTAKDWPSWEQSSHLFADTVLQIARRETPTQEMLKHRTEFYKGYYQLAQDSRNQLMASRGIKGSSKNLVKAVARKVLHR
jgi:glycosyltransferase involved in cell wall biosynthesis